MTQVSSQFRADGAEYPTYYWFLPILLSLTDRERGFESSLLHKSGAYGAVKAYVLNGL